MPNDAISSLKVSSGYQVILYEHDNFGGTAVTTSTDLNCLVNQNFNDLTSSLRIVATGAAPSAATTAQTAPAGKYLLKGLTIYPNPVANTLYVKGSDDLSGADVTVTDMMGRMKIRNRLSGNSVNVSGLPSGVYWITIVKNGKKSTLSFVK